MRNYLNEQNSCQHIPQSYHAQKARSPLRVLQILSVAVHPAKMSSSTHSGVPRSNVPASKQFTENKQKRNAVAASSSLLKERTPVNSLCSGVNRSVSPNNTVNDKLSFQPTLSISKTKSHKIVTDQKNRNVESSDIPVNKVGSLTSSPKWSRIKDKFENTVTDPKSKLTRSSSLSRSEIESLTPKKFTSQSTSKSLTSLSFDTHLSSSQSNSVQNNSNFSKHNSERLKIISTKHRFQSNSDDKSNMHQNKDKLYNVPSNDARRKDVSEISRLSNNSYRIPLKTDTASEKTEKNMKSKHIPLSAKAAASRLIPSSTTALNKSEQRNSISAASKKLVKDKSTLAYGLQASVKLSGRRSPYRSVTQSARTKTGDTKSSIKSESKSLSDDVRKTSSAIKDDFKATSQITNITKINSENDHCCSDINSSVTTLSGNLSSNTDSLSSPAKGNVKSIWVKDSIGGWRKQTSVLETNMPDAGNDSKVASKNKCGSSPKDSNAQNVNESYKENKNQLYRSSTTSSVPAKSEENNSEMMVRQLNKSNTTSNISSVMQLKHQNEENRSVDVPVVSESSKQNITAVLAENSKLKSCRATNEDNVKQGSPENIRKLQLVQKAVLCYEGNASTLSPETQRKLKLISEKIKAQTDDDKLLVAKAKEEILNVNTYRKNIPVCTKTNGDKTLGSDCSQKSKAESEPVRSVRSFLSRYQTINKSLEITQKTNLSKHEKTSTNSTTGIQKASEVQGKFGSKQASSMGKNKIPNQNNKVLSGSGSGKINEPHSTEKNLSPIPTEKKSSAKIEESPEHNTYANHVVDDRFLFSKEKKLPKKLSRVGGKLDHPLQPNASFLWRNSSSTEDEPKNSYSTYSALKKQETDDHNYYDLENYYASLDRNRDSKKNSTVDDPIYSESEYNSFTGVRGSTVSSTIDGMPPLQGTDRGKFDTDDGWTDISDEDAAYGGSPGAINALSSTLKKKRNKKYTARKAPLRRSRSQNLHDITNASDSCENSDWMENDSNLSSPRVDNESPDMADHLYEPVYESLGNYMVSDVCEEKPGVPLSPADSEPAKDAHSAFTSLESVESNGPAAKLTEKSPPDVLTDGSESSTGIGKKAGDKIRQLKRHLSWSKNDFKLELSSKFNKIKIQKDLHDTTEIGVRVHEDNPPSVASKKKTFIRCILKHKNPSAPIKRTVSPKKENAMFYVHLSMGREKQRPFSDSCVETAATETSTEEHIQKLRKRSDPSISICNSSRQSMRQTRAVSNGPTIQRPKTPPPLPPTNYMPKDNVKGGSSDNDASRMSDPKMLSKTDPQETANHRMSDDLLEFQIEHRQSITSLSSIIDSFPVSSIFFQRTRSSVASSVSGESYAPADESGSSGTSSSTAYSLGMTPPASEADAFDYSVSRTGSLTSGLSLPPLGDFKSDLLRSPFEEEPMYQFYHKDVQQRATLWCTTDGSESEFEDDMISKPIEQNTETTVKSPPVLQTQLSAMDLIHGEGGQRTLWCEVPDVQKSGILEKISPQDRKIQEAMFEVITSEASYLKSLNFLWEHFVQCPEFSGDYAEKHVLDKRERHVLFSDIPPVRDVSARLLADLEKRWLENILLSNICDIIYHHASKYFSVYVKYCSNQLYQERTLKELKENRPEFVEVLKRLESSSVCQGLDMHSFLLLPMQRITRLPLLVDAIFHRISVDSPIYESCKMALATLNKIVAECNEGARKMERMEEMLLISQHLNFRECKGLGLLSASRWLVKKGELVRLLLDTTNRRTFGRNVRWCKIHLYVFLFTDLLVVTRKKSDDSYTVVDYCPRNMVQVMPVDENTTPLPARLPSSYKNLFQLIMLHNQEGRTVEMILSCLLESDRTRWMDALTPAKSENPDEKIYEEWDCPQVQCTHSYTAQQPDELSLEEADVVNVFRKMSDGWYEGERIRDGVRGWFPSSHTVEIISSHVRARNLRQRYRLLVLSQTYLEEQYRATQAKGK